MAGDLATMALLLVTQVVAELGWRVAPTRPARWGWVVGSAAVFLAWIGVVGPPTARWTVWAFVAIVLGTRTVVSLVVPARRPDGRNGSG